MKLSGAPFYPQFAIWGYFGGLVSGATYEPPDDTIVHTATLSIAAKLEVYQGGLLLKEVPAAGVFGFEGSFFNTLQAAVTFKNTDVAQKNLRMNGVTITE